MKSQSNWNLNPDRSSWHQNKNESLIRKQSRGIHDQKFEFLNLHELSRNWIQYAFIITPNGLLTHTWLYFIIFLLIFMAFHEEKHSLMNAVIEFNMIASPNRRNRNRIEIWVQIGAAGIRTERNQWWERISETLVIKNLMRHWTFIKSREIEYNMLPKPLRMDSWPSNYHAEWIQDFISLIFVEKTIHSLNARAGADSRASSETARPGEFQTFTCKPGSAKRCKQAVSELPIRNVTETPFENCANREFTECQLET